MVDQFGRTCSRAQAIRGFDKIKMAYLFDDMKKNPTKYPYNVVDWTNWLSEDSGDNIDDF